MTEPLAVAGDYNDARGVLAGTNHMTERDEWNTMRAVIRRLLTPRNEVEFKLGDGWALRNELWSYVPESDAELALLMRVSGEGE